MKKLCLFALTGLALVSCAPKTETPVLKVTVTNTLGFDRNGELADVSWDAIRQKLGITTTDSLIVLNDKGEQLPYQLSMMNPHMATVMFPATVAANGKAEYCFTIGEPEEFTPVVAGRQYPERVDDFAWENEFSAYRCYGPELQASGERAYGFDVWTKSNTRDLVVESRYNTEHGARHEIDSLKAAGNTAAADSVNHATSYHFDHGFGLDCYKVGATLGGGAPALYKDNEIIYPYCYTDYEILEEGPLALYVKFDFEKKTLDGKEYTEHRILGVQAGSRMNMMIVNYEGLTDGEAQVAAGIVTHTESAEYVINPEKKYIAYADPTDPSQGGVDVNGKIFIGIVAPFMADAKIQPWGQKENPLDMKARSGATGHVLAILPTKNATAFYFFGSSWSKGDMPDMAAWQKYLDEFSQKSDPKNFLQLEYEGKPETAKPADASQK